jgi:putative ABC transport system permease protein
MDQLARDLRFAARSFRRSPGLTLAALLALGLGVGATAAIYTVVDAVLLEPLAYPEPDELVLLIDSNPEAGFPRFSASPPNFADWREQNRSFEHLAAFSRANLALDAPGVEPERLSGATVGSGFFEALAVAPLHGRIFRAEEDGPGAEAVTVLGHGLWQRRFGARPEIVGRTVTVNGEARRVVGVMPAGFAFPSEVEIWVPLALEIDPNQRGAHYLGVLGRLRDGVTRDAAQAEMTGITARLAEEYPDSNEGWGVNLLRVHELMVEDVRPYLRIVAWAVAAVLLIVCANVANLLLVRAARRERELAVRTALGAGRGRLARQLLTETFLLSLAGGALGLGFGLWGTRALVALNADEIPRAAEIGLDPSVFLFTFGMALAAGLLAGLAPVVHAARADLQGSLKEGTSAAGEGGRARALRKALVLVEVAVAVVLLVAAGLLLRSLLRLQGISPGFEPAGVLTAQVSLPDARYPDDIARAPFYRQLRERLEALPGVEAAGAGFPLPLSGAGYFLAFGIEGREAPPPQDAPSAGIRFVTPGYLEALEIPLVDGRRITDADRAGAVEVAVVNRAMAERLWPGESPLGGRFTFGDPTAPDAEWLEIVGVVGDVRHGDLTTEPDMEVYLAMDQSPFSTATLVLRTGADPESLTSGVREAVRAVDPSLPVYRVQTLEQVAADALADQRFSAVLLAVFAGLALVLASLGVYGVLSYAVSQRTRELGLRMALGAPRERVLRQVIGEGMVLVAIGVAAGTAGAFAASRLLGSLLYEVGTADPLTYAAVPALLVLVGLAAVWLPARRATRVEPVVALRTE